MATIRTATLTARTTVSAPALAKALLTAAVVTLGASGFSSAALGAAPDAVEVCQACEVKTIGDGVKLVSSGGTISVGFGEYKETGIVIDKPLRLKAADGRRKPIVDGGEGGTIFDVRASGVEIAGFVIRNSGHSYTDEIAGIKVREASGCRFADNDLLDNQFGIYLGRVRSCVIARNRIIGTNETESKSGNGIHVWHGEGLSIEHNFASKNRDGLYFEFVKDSFVRTNESVGNMRYGLHFMFSNMNEYRNNTFRDNGSGVAVMYSNSIRMFGNRFEDSRGGAAYGILLKDIADSVVGGNRFSGNTVGAYLEGTTRSEFSGNAFSSNGWALRVLGDCDSNTFSGNDFVGNTFDVSTNANSNHNLFERNFWGRYRGIDLDGDGTGDDPYHPVRLSAMIMERFETSALLINSFFFSVLDEIESVLPVLTPEAFKDSKPRMSRATPESRKN